MHRQRVDRQPKRREEMGPILMITAAESGATSGDHTHRYLPIRMSADLAPSLGLHSLPEEGPQHNERVAAVRSRRLSDHRLIRWSPGAERLANSES